MAASVGISPTCAVLCGPHIGSQQVCSVRRGKARGKRTRLRSCASSSPCVADFILLYTLASSPWYEYSVILRECLQAEVVSNNKNTRKKFHETWEEQFIRAMWIVASPLRLCCLCHHPLPLCRPSPCTRRRRQDAALTPKQHRWKSN